MEGRKEKRKMLQKSERVKGRKRNVEKRWMEGKKKEEDRKMK